jgi:photosystem II stability/assembly factor-like uncharacterized protein
MWQRSRKIVGAVSVATAGVLVGLSPAAGALPTWTQLRGTDNWNTATISGNGQYGLAGGTDGSRLYLIKDNNTISETRPDGNTNQNWMSVAISYTGNRMLAADGLTVKMSSDAGTTWTNVNPAGAQAYFTTVSVNGSGSTMLAGVQGGRLYLSTNGGASWAETRPAGNTDQQWYTSGVSKDGKTMLVGTNGGRIYLSKDSGATWAETQPAGNADKCWRVSEVKGGGQILFVASRGGRVYKSTNAGTSWTETQPAGNNDLYWMKAGMSEDGQNAIIGYDTGRLYVTSNGGTSWTETQPSGNSNRYWYAIAMNEDGTRMLAGSYINNLYVAGTIGDGSAPSIATADSDGDGIADSTEDAMPNAGDANNDGVLDSLQSNVTSFTNPVTNKAVSVEVAGSCTLSSVTSANEAANGTQDVDYTYPAGLVNFTAGCGTNSFTSTVKLFYYNLADNNLVLRKYKSPTYSTISGATKQSLTIGGQSVLSVTYSVTDGGLLDADGTANGTIVDPAGLASAVAGTSSGGTLTNTGTNSMFVMYVASGLFVASAFVALWPRPKQRV